MRIFDHLAERDAPIRLGGLDDVRTAYRDPETVIAEALALEQHTTRLVNALYAESVELGDYQAKALMDWFVNEQIEEEDTLRTLAEPGADCGQGRGRTADPGPRTGGPLSGDPFDARRYWQITEGRID